MALILWYEIAVCEFFSYNFEFYFHFLRECVTFIENMILCFLTNIKEPVFGKSEIKFKISIFIFRALVIIGV